MNKKYIIIIIILLALSIVAAIAIGLYFSNASARKFNGVLKEVRIDLKNILSGKTEYNVSINEDDIISNVEMFFESDFFKRTKTKPSDYNIEYFRKEYYDADLPLSLRLTVYPDDAKYFAYAFAKIAKRDISKEMQEIISRNDGEHRGVVVDFLPYQSDYTIKTIGDKKVQIYDQIAPNSDLRIYRFFAGGHSIRIWYMFQHFPRDESPNKYNYKSDQIFWDKTNLKNFQKIEKMIAEAAQER